MKQLMLIDLQRGLCEEGGPGASGLSDQVADGDVLGNAATALAAARAAGVGVTHVRLAFLPGHTNRTNRTARFGSHEEAGRFSLGSKETEFCDEVAPAEGEQVVEKGSISPFASTPLLAQYAARGVTELFIAGVATHLAVEAAVREAADRGFAVTVIEDACASPDPALHAHSLKVLDPMLAGLVKAADLAF